MQQNTRKPTDSTPFFYTEECGLALMLSPKSGRKLAVDTRTWEEVMAGFRAGWRPGAGPLDT